MYGNKRVVDIKKCYFVFLDKVVEVVGFVVVDGGFGVICGFVFWN